VVELAKSGCKVVAVDRNTAAIDKLNNSAIQSYTLDLLNTKGQKTLFEDVIKQYGRVDILVNNAGVFERITQMSFISFC
jgi:NADP-dependent 3-hydroxy acid dehydrogenase YdfG